MDSTRKLWIGLATLLIVSFAILLAMGGEIHRKAPPMPEQVVGESGEIIFTRADIEQGRIVWQSIGGMQLGSIWGHGSYVAPDWSADWLHREAVALADIWSRRETGAEFSVLGEEQQAALAGRLRTALRANTYDGATGRIMLSTDRVAAISNVAAHYESLFGNDPATATLREAYAMKNNTMPDASHRRHLTAFFWWTAWAAMTERPGGTVTYRNNWPGEPLIGNRPTAGMYLWSAFSVVFLIAGIALLGWHHAITHGRGENGHRLPATDPLIMVRVTPSMKATSGYFWVVLALFLVQILLGAMTAHYQVEGQQLYGFELADVIPYSLTRTWHTQLAVLWIATAWLGTALYIAPAISGHEPRYQNVASIFCSCAW
jgi:nitric oxide reductase subunit B